MLRMVSRFNAPARRAVQTAGKSFTAAASGHSMACRCGSCMRHAASCTCPACQSRGFAVKSQSSYDIPKTQTAVMFEEYHAPLQVRKDWPVTQPEDLKPGEVLVRMAYSGVCHTDVHVWHGEGPPPVEKKLPLVGGHEGTGYVAAIGANTNTKLKVGDAVGVKWLASSCLGCEDCRKGHEPTCDEVELHGYSKDGSFQQWCVSYADHVTPLPKGLPLDAAAPILCAGVTVYKALRQIEGGCGDSVVISGAGGGLGHLACQYARSMGYNVIAVDSGDERRALLESHGFTDFIDFKDGDVAGQVRARTDGRGAHAVVVVAASGEAYKDPLTYLRPNGTLVAVGVPGDGEIRTPVEMAVACAFRIVGSYVGNRQDAVESLKMAATGAVKTSFSVEPLENLPSVFERLAADKLIGRVVLDCE